MQKGLAAALAVAMLSLGAGAHAQTPDRIRCFGEIATPECDQQYVPPSQRIDRPGPKVVPINPSCTDRLGPAGLCNPTIAPPVEPTAEAQPKGAFGRVIAKVRASLRRIENVAKRSQRPKVQ